MRTLPMFPLGSVLLPFAALGLHVFEPRYRALVEECLAGEPEFGVVLIERGSEVGGGDARFELGTVARIIEAGRFPDGRYALATVGTRRLRVVRWLPDDPYPRAEVELLDEPVAQEGDAQRRDGVGARLRRVLALAAELGEHVPPADVVLAPDPAVAAYEAGALAPLGPLDTHRVLAAASVAERLDLLAALLDDAEELLRLRLGPR